MINYLKILLLIVANVLHTGVSCNPVKTGFLFLPEKGDFLLKVGRMIFFKEIRLAIEKFF
jgi:hypothetical protein